MNQNKGEKTQKILKNKKDLQKNMNYMESDTGI